MAEIPELVAIKEASFDVAQTSADDRGRARLDRPIGVLTGSDTFIFEAMVMGCDGRPDRLCRHRHGGARRHERRRASAASSRAGKAIWARLGPLARYVLAPADPRLPPAHEGGAELAGPSSRRPLAASRNSGSDEAERAAIAALCRAQGLVPP